MNNKKLSHLNKWWHELRDSLALIFKSLPERVKHITILLLGLLTLASIVLVFTARNRLMVTQAIPGGSWSEGVIGTARFINPVLAVSNVDRDLTALVFSGLMRRTQEGSYEPDLAESYTISPDGLQYTFVIKKNTKFQNGTKVTADDIVYTIDRIHDPIEKSPHYIEWEGVTAEKIDDATVRFTLKQPFSDFLELATIGVLPKSVYGKYNANEFALAKENINAIGSGPYKINRVSLSSGIPSKIKLKRNTYGDNDPNIKTIYINIYETEKEAISALYSGNIDHLGSVTPKEAQNFEDKGYTVTKASFPRLYGLFFNTKKSTVLQQPNTTIAIDRGIDKQNLIDTALYGFGTKIDSPLPESIATQIKSSVTEKSTENILESYGWKKNSDGMYEKKVKLIPPGSKKAVTKTQVLEFTITTSDTPELRMGAELIATSLKEHGILAHVESFDTNTLEEKIRTRDYDALYYGILVGRESQVYAFWHSSQKVHPGLNISEYTNPKIDTILESLQKETNTAKRNDLWQKFMTNFESDMPASFIYSPTYIYVHRNKPLFTMQNDIHLPSDRFNNIRDWYVETERVLPLFTKK